jgi:hypothetical protein
VLYEDVSACGSACGRRCARARSGSSTRASSRNSSRSRSRSAPRRAGADLQARPAISVGPDGTQGYSPATLYGRPILTTEYNAALGTAGDIILANLGEYTLIDKGNVDQAVSLHVAFLTDEAVWRFTYRADGQLNWNAALTPKSGGSTLSPVVALTT